MKTSNKLEINKGKRILVKETSKRQNFKSTNITASNCSSGENRNISSRCGYCK
jgi:hypothetical protein